MCSYLFRTVFDSFVFFYFGCSIVLVWSDRRASGVCDVDLIGLRPSGDLDGRLSSWPEAGFAGGSPCEMSNICVLGQLLDLSPLLV